MKQRIIYTVGSLTSFFSGSLKHQILIMFCFILLFLCPLFLRNRTQSKTGLSEIVTDASVTTVPSISSTKWWIKPTATTSQSTLLTQNVTNVATDTPARNCSLGFPSPLALGTYAYISLTPSLPSRIRAGAGRANTYLGQIYPGGGVKIIEGPSCIDGFSWWLVETIDNDLRGWTVAGNNSEQWVLPCPNPAVACKMSQAIQQAAPTTTHSSTQDDNDHKCTSSRIFIGMRTQVKEDNLLVVRSEPYTGSVIGYAGPTSAVIIIDGPACTGGAVWWEVNVPSLNLTGWATEANLPPCTKEDDCT